MRRSHKVASGAVAAVIAAGGAVYVLQDRAEKAEREALRVTAEAIFQREADTDPQWRKTPSPAGRVWGEAKSKAVVHHIEKHGERAKVWVDDFTTPYTTAPSGADPQPTIPYASSHVFLFEPDGDGWRLVEDLTEKEFAH